MTHEFQCEYCPKWFSKHSALRNHLRSHHDQMYLDETGLSREENTTVRGPLLNTSQEYKLFMENLNIHWQNKISLTSTIFTKIINQYKLTLFWYCTTLQAAYDTIYGNDNIYNSDNNENLNSNENLRNSSNENSSDNNSNNSSEGNSNENSNDEEPCGNLNEASTSKNEGYDIIDTINSYEIQRNIIDVRSAQKVQETSNSTSSFPNPAYEAFVQLVTKHKLADSVTNDIIHLFNNFHMNPAAILPSNAKSVRTLFDSIKISHILYTKTIVMEYNQVQYMLHHRSIFDVIKELLSNKEIFKYCIFNYEPKYTTNNLGERERSYSKSLVKIRPLGQNSTRSNIGQMVI